MSGSLAREGDGDLIDLHVGSPPLVSTMDVERPSSGEDETPKSLLDLELQVLDGGLFEVVAEMARSDGCVDVEDVLISIDDEDDMSVEDCLEDLDNYLRAFESSVSEEDVEEENVVEDEISQECGQINGAFVDDEGNPYEGAFVRRHPLRATVAADPDFGQHQQLNLDVDKSQDRFSACDLRAVGTAPAFRPGHQAPPGRISATDDLLDDRVRELRAPSPPSWLRSSMRRIRHLRLPSAGETFSPTVESTPEAIVVQVDPPSPAASLPDAQEASNSTRPFSAPSRLAPLRGAGSFSSSESSVASSVDTTPSCATPAPTSSTTDHQESATQSRRRSCDTRARRDDMPQLESPLGHWPHGFSSLLACLSCTLGLFNISRFAVLSVYFGANFIFQFCLLSIVLGLPLFTLHTCLGQQLGAGVVDMWRISPLFQGVGVALLASQALVGLYSITGVSWMFVYFRDSFITKMDTYRWAEQYYLYRNEGKPYENVSYPKLSETVPDYFSGVVLQRHHINSNNYLGTIKFQSAFNLAVVWMIVFVCLSKGLRSYGKVIYVFTILPIIGTFVVCAKMLSLVPPGWVYVVFPETSWNEFFLNSKSWVAAGQEVFLTWGLLGASIMQLASHNKHKNLLYRDSSLIAITTFSILLLSAFLANTCVQILRSNGYIYVASSFEKMKSYSFLKTYRDLSGASGSSAIPVKYMNHQSFVVGERVFRSNNEITSESGYQALRLATELVPAALALMGPDEISPFWVVLFYFNLILFGIAQQLAIWHCVITGILAIKANVLKSWETTVTFFSCASGYLLGLPMATEFGIYVVYFLDFTVGGLWWLVLIVIIEIVAVFMIRGRPYSGDSLVNVFFFTRSRPCLLNWTPALLSFTWNVVLPIGLTVCCISFFRNGNFKELFVWHHAPRYEYWPLWARQIGSMIQLLPVLCVPIVAVIQSYRYLNNGPNDILDRVQLLYRPPLGEHMEDLPVVESSNRQNNSGNSATTVTSVAAEDPPPKYTPPPSYTTATGARLAKFLRHSIRRSIRRIANVLGEGSSGSAPGARRAPDPRNLQQAHRAPPPDYSVVLVEIGSPGRTADTAPDCQPSSPFGRELSAHTQAGSALTIADVASILRNSFRRSRISRAASNLRRANASASAVSASSADPSSLSAENLVDAAAPIGETSLVMESVSREVSGTTHTDRNEADTETVKTDNFSTVI